MNVSAHEEYGLRCALRLARAFGHGPLPASKIAEAEGISVEYVSKFMHFFRKAGLVQAARGTSGGFQLSEEPGKLAVNQVLLALDPNGISSENFCSQFSGKKDVCVNYQDCSIRPLWSLFTFHFDSILKQISLADLLDEESVVRSRVEEILVESLQSSKRKAVIS